MTSKKTLRKRRAKQMQKQLCLFKNNLDTRESQLELHQEPSSQLQKLLELAKQHRLNKEYENRSKFKCGKHKQVLACQLLKRAETISVDIDSLEEQVYNMSGVLRPRDHQLIPLSQSQEKCSPKDEPSSSSGGQSPSRITSMLIKRKREEEEKSEPDESESQDESQLQDMEILDSELEDNYSQDFAAGYPQDAVIQKDEPSKSAEIAEEFCVYQEQNGTKSVSKQLGPTEFEQDTTVDKSHRPISTDQTPYGTQFSSTQVNIFQEETRELERNSPLQLQVKSPQENDEQLTITPQKMNFCIPSPSSEISNFQGKETIKDEQENESKYDLFCQALQSLKIDKDVAKLSVAEETFSPAPYLQVYRDLQNIKSIQHEQAKSLLHERACLQSLCLSKSEDLRYQFLANQSGATVGKFAEPQEIILKDPNNPNSKSRLKKQVEYRPGLQVPFCTQHLAAIQLEATSFQGEPQFSKKQGLWQVTSGHTIFVAPIDH